MQSGTNYKPTKTKVMQNANPILFQDLIKMDNREFIGQSSANDGMFRTYWKVGDKTYFVVQFLF
jgi:hypothetical protein